MFLFQFLIFFLCHFIIFNCHKFEKAVKVKVDHSSFQPWVSVVGGCMMVLGDFIRKLAMVTAAENFDHIVQTSKADNHQVYFISSLSLPLSFSLSLSLSLSLFFYRLLSFVPYPISLSLYPFLLQCFLSLYLSNFLISLISNLVKLVTFSM